MTSTKQAAYAIASRVGYAQSSLQSGNTLAGVQFVNVGTEADMPPQSIKPTGTDVSDNIVIQTLDAYGRTVDSYLWIDWAGDESDQEAWVNDETYEIIDGVSFAPKLSRQYLQDVQWKMMTNL